MYVNAKESVFFVINPEELDIEKDAVEERHYAGGKEDMWRTPLGL